MITEAIEEQAFIKITRGILEKTNEGGICDVLDCINYMRRHGIKTEEQALDRYKELTTEFDSIKTYGIIAWAIRKQGIEKVRKVIYGDDYMHNNCELVAMTMYLNSRMAKVEMQNKIEKMSN